MIETEELNWSVSNPSDLLHHNFFYWENQNLVFQLIHRPQLGVASSTDCVRIQACLTIENEDEDYLKRLECFYQYHK